MTIEELTTSLKAKLSATKSGGRSSTLNETEKEFLNVSMQIPGLQASHRGSELDDMLTRQRQLARELGANA